MKEDKLKEMIMNETTNHCSNCPLKERCIEERCVVYRIEQLCIDKRWKDEKESKKNK